MGTETQKNQESEQVVKGLMCVLISAVLYGIWPAAARAVYADGGNAALVMFVNAGIRALVIGVLCLTTQKTIFASRTDLKAGIIGGLYQAVALIGIYRAAEYLPGPVLITIVNFSTVLLLFYSVWRRDIVLDWMTVCMTALVLFGLSLAVDVWHHRGSADPIGYYYILAGTVATVARLYTFGQQMKVRHPVRVAAENLVPAIFFILPYAFIEMPHLPLSSVGYEMLAVGAVASAISGLSMFYGIAFLGAFRYSLFMKLEPVFTVLFSILLLHELLSPLQYVGIFLVTASLALYQLKAVVVRKKKNT